MGQYVSSRFRDGKALDCSARRTPVDAYLLNASLRRSKGPTTAFYISQRMMLHYSSHDDRQMSELVLAIVLKMCGLGAKTMKEAPY